MNVDPGTPVPNKRDAATQMAGCGCLVLLAIFFGPLLTNWVGLSPWPVTITFALALAVAWFSPTHPFPFPRAFLLTLLVIGAFGGFLFADDVAKDKTKAEAAPPAAPEPTPEPQKEATPTPAPEPEKVRITIDEIHDKFARNQIAGATFFETRTAIIPAVAVRVREALGTGILVVRSPRTGREMELGFNERGTRQLAEIEPSDRIEATCPEILEAMGQIIIACEDITIKPQR